jgi:predicted AAA+ superfamily ATPase
MPECVLAWINSKDPEKVKQVQSELVTLYENDFSKHNGKVNSGRILLVFRSIVTQLAKENEKFIYGCVKEGARAREFEEAIEWLVSAGMVIRTYNVSKNEHPLNAFQQPGTFKLFMFDVGLLKHMAGVSNEAILLKSDYQFKGPLTENYVLQQIRDMFDVEPKFFAQTGPSLSEIDFLLQNGVRIIPVEVKSGENIRSTSFNKYLNKYSPANAVIFSKLEYHKGKRSTVIPLYLAGKTKELM